MSGRRRRGCLAWLVILAAAALLCFFAFDPRIGVSTYRIRGEALPEAFDGFKILQITDLHCKRFGENQSGLMKKIDKLEPDLVVLTGDMMDENILDFDPVAELCHALTEKYTVYAVWGNHDRWLSRADFNRLKALLADAGVTVLTDESALLEKGGAHIVLHGADDPPVWNDGDTAYVAEHGLKTAPQGPYDILLIHRANLFPAVSPLGFDLVISGHMHGGQVRLPFAGGLISPTRQWFPKYTAGLFEENGTSMVVCRGLGNAISVPRVFNPPELVQIILVKG